MINIHILVNKNVFFFENLKLKIVYKEIAELHVAFEYIMMHGYLSLKLYNLIWWAYLLWYFNNLIFKYIYLIENICRLCAGFQSNWYPIFSEFQKGSFKHYKTLPPWLPEIYEETMHLDTIPLPQRDVCLIFPHLPLTSYYTLKNICGIVRNILQIEVKFLIQEKCHCYF